MLLLIVDTWVKTQDGRWFISGRTEYYLTKPRIERRDKLFRNPQKLEELEKANIEKFQADQRLW